MANKAHAMRLRPLKAGAAVFKAQNQIKQYPHWNMQRSSVNQSNAQLHEIAAMATFTMSPEPVAFGRELRRLERVPRFMPGCGAGNAAEVAKTGQGKQRSRKATGNTGPDKKRKGYERMLESK